MIEKFETGVQSRAREVPGLGLGEGVGYQFVAYAALRRIPRSTRLCISLLLESTLTTFTPVSRYPAEA